MKYQVKPDLTPEIAPASKYIHQHDAFQIGKAHGIYERFSDSVDGLIIERDSSKSLSFVNMDYLGLSQHPIQVAAAQKVIDSGVLGRHGGHVFVESPYEAWSTRLLSEIFGGCVLITKSVSDGTIMIMTSLVDSKDILILDKSVHFNVHHGAEIAKAFGTEVLLVDHMDLEGTTQVIQAAVSKGARRVWFCSDGVYSMLGDYIPTSFYQEMLDIAPNVYLYVDDAHGTSIIGKHGCGHFLERMPIQERVIVAVSLNKGFGAVGGCLVFSSEEELQVVRSTAIRRVYSAGLSPIDYALIGASAKFHLSSDIAKKQDILKENNELFLDIAKKRNIPLICFNETAIHFLPTYNYYVTVLIVNRLLHDGFDVGAGVYPGRPRGQEGIRITITAMHNKKQIQELCESLVKHYFTSISGKIKITSYNCKQLSEYDKSILKPELIDVIKKTFQINDHEKIIDHYVFDHKATKNYLSILRDKSGKSVGFLVSPIHKVKLNDECLTVYRPNITLVKQYRGQSSIFEVQLRDMAAYLIAHPNEKFVFFGVSVHPMNYLLLSKYFSIYPERERSTSPKANVVLDAFCDWTYGEDREKCSEYPHLVKASVITKTDEEDVEKTETLAKRPELQFYLRNNPVFAEGWALPFMVPITAHTLLRGITLYERQKAEELFYSEKIHLKKLCQARTSIGSSLGSGPKSLFEILGIPVGDGLFESEPSQ